MPRCVQGGHQERRREQQQQFGTGGGIVQRETASPSPTSPASLQSRNPRRHPGRVVLAGNGEDGGCHARGLKSGVEVAFSGTYGSTALVWCCPLVPSSQRWIRQRMASAATSRPRRCKLRTISARKTQSLLLSARGLFPGPQVLAVKATEHNSRGPAKAPHALSRLSDAGRFDAARARFCAGWSRFPDTFTAAGNSPTIRNLTAAYELITAGHPHHTRPPYGIEAVHVGNREVAVTEEALDVTPFGTLLTSRRISTSRSQRCWWWRRCPVTSQRCCAVSSAPCCRTMTSA